MLKHREECLQKTLPVPDRNRRCRSAVGTCATEYPAVPCHARRVHKVRSAYRCWSSAHGRRGLKDSISTQCRFHRTRRRTGLSRVSAPPDKKIAGGQPPAPGSPSFRKDLFYFLIEGGFMQDHQAVKIVLRLPNEKPLSCWYGSRAWDRLISADIFYSHSTVPTGLGVRS